MVEYLKLGLLILGLVFIEVSEALGSYSHATIEDFTGGDPYLEVVDPPSLKYSYRLKPARFGGSFTQLQRGVSMVFADPEECCSPLYNANEVAGAVVLVNRGSCSFVSKAQQAEDAGAIAVIVTELSQAEPTQRHVSMVDDDTGRSPSIPAYFLLGGHGDAFRAAMSVQGYAFVNLPRNMSDMRPDQLRPAPYVLL